MWVLTIDDSLASLANAPVTHKIFIDARFPECYTVTRFGRILPSDARPSFAETRGTVSHTIFEDCQWFAA